MTKFWRLGGVLGLRSALLLLAGMMLSGVAAAHGERAQEPYLRTRTVEFYDVHFDTTRIDVNQQMTMTGRFHLMKDWPDAVARPEIVFLTVGTPGPVVTRVETWLNGVPARQSFGALELGRDYEFKIILKGRVPGTYHIHPMLSVKGSGPLIGPGQWITISGAMADFREPLTTLTGVRIDNLETFGVDRALMWYGVWIGLAALWLLFWLARPLLIPRWIALQKGREDLLITPRDLVVGLALGGVVVGLSFGSYAMAKSEYPYTVPLQAGTSRVEPLPADASDMRIRVRAASYDVPGRSMRIDATMTNTGQEPLYIREFTTANVRFVNLSAPGAAGVVDPAYPRELVARNGLKVSDTRPIAPGETRDIHLEATDAMWEVERLVSFLTDVDSKFGALLFFETADGKRQLAEIGGPILPVFTHLGARQ